MNASLFSSVPQNQFRLQLNNNERGYYASLHQQADPQDTNKIGGAQAVQFFKKSGLPVEILKKIWIISSQNKDALNREEFYIALKLISYAQNNLEVSKEAIMRGQQSTLPKFTNNTTQEASSKQGPQLNDYDFQIHPEQEQRYAKYAKDLDPYNTNYVQTAMAMQLFLKASLPQFQIQTIMNLIDPSLSNKIKISMQEYIVIAHLISLVKQGIHLPTTLPQILREYLKKEPQQKKDVGFENSFPALQQDRISSQASNQFSGFQQPNAQDQQQRQSSQNSQNSSKINNLLDAFPEVEQKPPQAAVTQGFSGPGDFSGFHTAQNPPSNSWYTPQPQPQQPAQTQKEKKSVQPKQSDLSDLLNMGQQPFIKPQQEQVIGQKVQSQQQLPQIPDNKTTNLMSQQNQISSSNKYGAFDEIVFDEPKVEPKVQSEIEKKQMMEEKPKFEKPKLNTKLEENFPQPVQVKFDDFDSQPISNEIKQIEMNNDFNIVQQLPNPVQIKENQAQFGYQYQGKRKIIQNLIEKQEKVQQQQQSFQYNQQEAYQLLKTLREQNEQTLAQKEKELEFFKQLNEQQQNLLKKLEQENEYYQQEFKRVNNDKQETLSSLTKVAGELNKKLGLSLQIRGEFIKDTTKGISDIGGYANTLLLNMGKTFQEEQEALKIRDKQFQKELREQKDLIKNLQQSLHSVPKKVDYAQIQIDQSPLKNQNQGSLQLQAFPQKNESVAKKDIASLYENQQEEQVKVQQVEQKEDNLEKPDPFAGQDQFNQLEVSQPTEPKEDFNFVKPQEKKINEKDQQKEQVEEFYDNLQIHEEPQIQMGMNKDFNIFKEVQHMESNNHSVEEPHKQEIEPNSMKTSDAIDLDVKIDQHPQGDFFNAFDQPVQKDDDGKQCESQYFGGQGIQDPFTGFDKPKEQELEFDFNKDFNMGGGQWGEFDVNFKDTEQKKDKKSDDKKNDFFDTFNW